MPCRRVLALGAFEQTARHRRRAGLRGTAFQRFDVAEAEGLQVREVETSYGARNVAEGVGALVAVFGGVRKLAGTHGIEHDDTRPRHAAIVGRR